MYRLLTSYIQNFSNWKVTRLHLTYDLSSNINISVTPTLIFLIFRGFHKNECSYQNNLSNVV